MTNPIRLASLHKLYQNDYSVLLAHIKIQEIHRDHIPPLSSFSSERILLHASIVTLSVRVSASNIIQLRRLQIIDARGTTRNLGPLISSISPQGPTILAFAESDENSRPLTSEVGPELLTVTSLSTLYLSDWLYRFSIEF